MRVTFYQRRPQGANFSVERVFADIRRALPEEVQARVAVSRFPSKGVWGRAYNIVEAAFRQGQVNHITGDVYFLAYLLSKKRTLLTILDLVTLHRPRGWRRSLLLFFWYWLPTKRAARISVISEFTKQELLQNIQVDPRRISVIYCPVSDDFTPCPSEFNAEKPVVLQIGTSANKNIERAAQALAGIPCRFRIVGKLNSEQLAVLKQCGIEYSSVSDLADDAVVEEYRRCDMVVFASTYEGFGLPILEAQATGRPVVTSNILSMPEVAGDAACLVDPLDVESIRAGVLKILTNVRYREELVRRGFENVKRFRAKRIAQEYVSVYKDLLRQD